MKKTIALLLLATKLFSQNGIAPEAGPRITFQKFDSDAAHVWAGTIISAGVGTWVYHKTKNTTLAMIAGGTAGVLKEAVYDKAMNRGVCSNADAFKTIWGAAVGVVGFRMVLGLKQQRDWDKQQYEDIGDSLRLYKTEPIVIKP